MLRVFTRLFAAMARGVRRTARSPVVPVGPLPQRSKVSLSYEFINSLMDHPLIHEAIRAKAHQVAASANRIIAQEGLTTIRAEVEAGTRPLGRAFANVVIDGGAQYEWGASNVRKRRILGRAADENR